MSGNSRCSLSIASKLSGLSLRTIQRIEGSNRAGFDSLVALATAFEIEVVALERELAMDKTSSGWKKRPGWVRALFLGSGRIQMDRQQHKKVEIVAVIAGAVLVATGVFGASGTFVSAGAVVPLLVCGSLLFLGAYLMSVIARVGDQYSVWAWLDLNAD